jgi:glutaredoxin
MTVILYTTHCPKCKVLEKKLATKNITYTEITDTDVMLKMGFDATPMLEVDGQIMDFKAASDWINNIS